MVKMVFLVISKRKGVLMSTETITYLYRPLFKFFISANTITRIGNGLMLYETIVMICKDKDICVLQYNEYVHVSN